MNEELIKKAAVKYASLISGENILKAVIGGAVVVGLSRMIDTITNYLDEWKVQRKSRDYYENMLEAHPELQKEDPEKVAKLWASLYHFAPYMAEDPIAAGAFIRQSISRGYMEEFGGPAPETFNTLADTNKKSIETQRGFRSRITDEAAKQWLGSVFTSVASPNN